MTKHGDYFVKRSINYSKRTQRITGDDLFNKNEPIEKYLK